MRLVEVATGISVNTDKIIAVEKDEGNDPVKTIIRLDNGLIQSDLDYETIIKRVKGIE